MNKNDLDNILNNSDFSNILAEAAPYRVKIIKDLQPTMKEIQKKFQDLMVEADYKDVSGILAKLKFDKKDETANLDMKAWRKDIMNMFKLTLKSIHPNENQKISIGMIYVAGKMLNYIGRQDIINSALEDRSIDIKFTKLEEINAKFDSDDMRNKFIDLFKQADECQGEICNSADTIKIDLYDQLPSTVKYDKKSNRSGLKQSNFCSLVRNKAMGVIQDSKKYTKYIEQQLKGTNENIDREEIMLGKTKQM